MELEFGGEGKERGKRSCGYGLLGHVAVFGGGLEVFASDSMVLFLLLYCTVLSRCWCEVEVVDMFEEERRRGGGQIPLTRLTAVSVSMTAERTNEKSRLSPQSDHVTLSLYYESGSRYLAK